MRGRNGIGAKDWWEEMMGVMMEKKLSNGGKIWWDKMKGRNEEMIMIGRKEEVVGRYDWKKWKEVFQTVFLMERLKMIELVMRGSFLIRLCKKVVKMDMQRGLPRWKQHCLKLYLDMEIQLRNFHCFLYLPLCSLCVYIVTGFHTISTQNYSFENLLCWPWMKSLCTYIPVFYYPELLCI